MGVNGLKNDYNLYFGVRQLDPCLDIATINDYSLFNQNRKLLKVNGLK